LTLRGGRPAPGPQPAGLRLRAEDAEDLAVISACVQDALVAVRDLAYDRAARTFPFVANRFRWEAGSGDNEAGLPFERTLCGIAFEAIDSVSYRGFHRSEEDRILALLAIQIAADATAAAGATIDLEFAGGAAIRLAGSAISCRVLDFGDPWPTAWRPGHALDEAP
jgi:Protein of unknown function (DUF2948)